MTKIIQIWKRFHKLFFLILFISFQYICNIYIKRIVNNYYNNRIKLIHRFHREYDESNLITLEDKLNWLAIHDVIKLKGKCSDKILLHEYSKRILKKDICNKILKIYNDSNEINIDELPEKFVLKTNHGSQFNIIVNNRSEFNLDYAKMNLSNWMKINYGKQTAEYHYMFIKRKIFAEEFIGDSLNNYKFFCYNSKPIFIYLSKKIGHNKYRTFFDMNWNKLDFDCITEKDPINNYTKPKTFELMKEYAHKLSRPFKFARVDLYEYKETVRLGEITFIPMNSFFFCKKKEHEIELGKYIKLF